MEEPESKEGFKVTDRRRFTGEGEIRDAEEEQEKPQEPVKEAGRQEEPPKSEAETKKAGSPPPPPLDFSMFIVSMANTAMFQLGLIQDPETGEARKDLQGARQTIDLIALLEEKTRGNLTDQEARIVKDALFQLRMAFVEAAK